MHIWEWLFPSLTWLLALGWAWQVWLWGRHLPDVPDLKRIPPRPLPSKSDRPHATVVVPACNEQASIAACLRSLLASEGIRLQIVAVNDRSTDQTGAIMANLAAEPELSHSGHTFEVLHIRELPPNWLGKPHALASGANLSQSEWILFTDGDVIFAPHAMALAIGYAESEQAGHLVLMPDLISLTHGEAAMHGVLHALSAWAIKLWRIPDPQAKDFIGVGGFNLIRRSAYEAVGGFTALRMEVVEDMRMGWLLKRAGFCARVALGPGLAGVRWSEGAWGVVRNLEKNIFAFYRYSVAKTLLAAFGVLIQVVWPIAAIASGGQARVAGIAIYVFVAALYFVSRSATQVPVAYVLLYPFATALFFFAILRSVVLTLFRGGVVWRGTFYSLKELRAHAGPFWY